MSDDRPEMTLDEAITVLCELHMVDVMEDDWFVQTSPSSYHPLRYEYERAWGTLRKRLLQYRGVLHADGAAREPV